MKTFLTILFATAITWFISTQLDINWPRIAIVQPPPAATPSPTFEPQKPRETITPQPPEDNIKPADYSEIEYDTFALINKERLLNGKSNFLWDNYLHTKCQEHSQYMAEAGNFVHSQYNFAENIFMLTYFGTNYDSLPKIIVDTWMNSPGHRSNLMSSQETHCAIGVAKSKSYTFYVTFVSN